MASCDTMQNYIHKTHSMTPTTFVLKLPISAGLSPKNKNEVQVVGRENDVTNNQFGTDNNDSVEVTINLPTSPSGDPNCECGGREDSVKTVNEEEDYDEEEEKSDQESADNEEPINFNASFDGAEEQDDKTHPFAAAAYTCQNNISSKDDVIAATSSSYGLCLMHQPQNSMMSKQTSGTMLENDLKTFDDICTIGTGTYGRVHLVRHKRNQQYYALKVMLIESIIRSKQVDHVHNEKTILRLIDHPFIIKLHCVFHDEKCLYMIMDYMPGGELFSYLRCENFFNDIAARFYAIEIILALEYLHSKRIVYRDLKPENIILDAEGHVKLTDFGFAKILLEPRTWTMCGTPEYLAPEVIQGKGHNLAVDWWALGILIYEMIIGRPPFFASNPLNIYEKILENNPYFPKHFPQTPKDLVRKLLVTDRTKRLGNMRGKCKDIKAHAWFEDVDWDEANERKLKPPIVPKVRFAGDSGNFDAYEEIELSSIKPATVKHQQLFENW